jgi:signal peptide peptidase SppA
METTTRTYNRLIRFVCEETWAVLPSTLALMRSLLRMRAAGMKFTAEEIVERIGAPEARDAPSTPSPASIAVIPVWGIIGHRANELRDISSAVGTSTEVLGAQIEAAAADPSIVAIVLDVNSPGGGVFGVQEVADTIRAARAKKPIVAVANALMASAAYWIGSAASELVVTPSGLVGSIGVFSIHEDHSKELATDGIDVTLIRAGRFKAEDNPFAPLTDEAKAAIQERVDGFYAQFTKAVAKGRNVSLDAVRNGFGEGRVVDAKQAVAEKMADRIATMDDVLADLASGKLPVAMKALAVAADVEERAPIAAGPADDDVAAAVVAAVYPGLMNDDTARAIVGTQDVAIVQKREETADERARRLRLRLLELS